MSQGITFSANTPRSFTRQSTNKAPWVLNFNGPHADKTMGPGCSPRVSVLPLKVKTDVQRSGMGFFSLIDCSFLTMCPTHWTLETVVFYLYLVVKHASREQGSLQYIMCKHVLAGLNIGMQTQVSFRHTDPLGALCTRQVLVEITCT